MGKLTRRKVLATGAGVVGAHLVGPRNLAVAGVWLQSDVKPVVIASANGNVHKNVGPRTCVEEAYERITAGSDVLEALIAGVNIVELDPRDTSVGYGGLPNADGVVQLDSCCMHGPKKWAGGVAALEGVRTPSSVAYKVASETDHHLLVGQGAQTFARNMGFTVEPDLNTDTSRRVWLEWKRRIDPGHYLDPSKRDGGGEAGRLALLAMIEEGLVDPDHAWGTINCEGVNGKGEICGVTTTSGLAFKIAGRVGDSPILGAGLYVDGAVGAAGSTGRGEANLFNCSSYLIVEEMRRGAHPKDAAMTAMARIRSNTREKRLLNEAGLPNFGMEFYVLDAKGRHAGVSASRTGRYAVCDEQGPRFVPSEYAWA